MENRERHVCKVMNFLTRVYVSSLRTEWSFVIHMVGVYAISQVELL